MNAASKAGGLGAEQFTVALRVPRTCSSPRALVLLLAYLRPSTAAAVAGCLFQKSVNAHQSLFTLVEPCTCRESDERRCARIGVQLRGDEMANRRNHYEAALEAFLRQRRVAYVAVNEQRRSCIPAGTLKSVDFLISPADGATLLVDVKGRRFPSGRRSKQYWKNWSTWDDLTSLARWQDQLGGQCLSLLAFVYDVVGERSPLPAEQLFPFRDRLYAMLAVRAVDYIRFHRPLSLKWQTVAMPTGRFREAAFPLADLLGARSPTERLPNERIKSLESAASMVGMPTAGD